MLNTPKENGGRTKQLRAVQIFLYISSSARLFRGRNLGRISVTIDEQVLEKAPM